MTDDLLYLLEEADSILKEKNPYTHELKMTIFCNNCRTSFIGHIEGAKKWYNAKEKFNYITYFCPQCPPDVGNKWLERSFGMVLEEVKPSKY